ncbi:MAG: DMT family transporter [Hyphomicrobiaceae bacterium]
MPDQPTRAPLLIVALIGLLWGLNWPAVKFMLTEMPPLTIRAVAFPFAAFLLALIASARGENMWPARHEWVPIVVTGTLVIFGFNMLTVLGQTLTETSKAAIIAYTMPVLTAMLAAAFLGERLETRHKWALLLGMAGLAVLASENVAALLAAPLGPLIMFGAALSWAGGNVAMKAFRWQMAPLARTVWFFVVSSVLSWPLVWIFEPLSEQNWPSVPVFATLLYHAIGPMVTCYALWTVLVGRLSATVAAIAALLAPFVGVSSSIILLGDPLTWQKIVSLAMILGSIFMTLAPVVQARRPAQPRA